MLPHGRQQAQASSFAEGKPEAAQVMGGFVAVAGQQGFEVAGGDAVGQQAHEAEQAAGSLAHARVFDAQGEGDGEAVEAGCASCAAEDFGSLLLPAPVQPGEGRLCLRLPGEQLDGEGQPVHLAEQGIEQGVGGEAFFPGNVKEDAAGICQF